MPSYTREQVEALTDSDVAAAKARAVEATKTRSGVSTIDYHLIRIGGCVTLEMAKAELIRKLEKQNG